jgi:hypothetical protein
VAEAGDAAINEARVVRLEAGEVEVVAGEVAGLEVLDQDVGAGEELEEGRVVVRAREVEGPRALVAIGGEVVGGRAGVLGRGPSGGCRRPGGARS